MDLCGEVLTSVASCDIIAGVDGETRLSDASERPYSFVGERFCRKIRQKSFAEINFPGTNRCV